MTPPEPCKYSFWLLPTEADRHLYQNLIHQLSRSYDAPVFEPHVTIYSGMFAPDTSPETLLSQAIAGIHPFTMHVDGLRYMDIFTKSLFIQLQPSQPLQTLSETLRHQALPPSDYVLDPHLSLMYQHLSEPEKQQIVASMHLPTSHITFDKISIILTPTPTRTPDDVARWREVARQTLPGPLP